MNEAKKPMMATPTRAPAIPPTTFPTLTPEVGEAVLVADGNTVVSGVMDGSGTVPKELVATIPGAVINIVLRVCSHMYT